MTKTSTSHSPSKPSERKAKKSFDVTNYDLIDWLQQVALLSLASANHVLLLLNTRNIHNVETLVDRIVLMPDYLTSFESMSDIDKQSLQLAAVSHYNKTKNRKYSKDFNDTKNSEHDGQLDALHLLHLHAKPIDLEQLFFNRDDKDTFIGHGAFADVYLGKYTIQSNTYEKETASAAGNLVHVAIKILKDFRPESVVDFEREAKIMSFLSFRKSNGISNISAIRGITTFFGCQLDHSVPRLIVMELAHCTLYDIIYNSNELFKLEYRNNLTNENPYLINKKMTNITIIEKLQLLLDAAKGLEYLHSCNILHNDLKPDNFFYYYHNNTLKLADFGLANISPSTAINSHSPKVNKSKSKQSSTMKEQIAHNQSQEELQQQQNQQQPHHHKGNQHYQAPEILQMIMDNRVINDGLSTASDLYAFIISANEFLTEERSQLLPSQLIAGIRPKIVGDTHVKYHNLRADGNDQNEEEENADEMVEGKKEEVIKRLQHLIKQGWEGKVSQRVNAKGLCNGLEKIIAVLQSFVNQSKVVPLKDMLIPRTLNSEGGNGDLAIDRIIQEKTNSDELTTIREELETEN